MDLLKASALLQGFRQVVLKSQNCIRNISPRSRCSCCSDVCPVNGVKLTSVGIIIEDCIGCGLCVGVCPGQALGLPTVDWIGETWGGGGGEIFFHCKKIKAESQLNSRGITVPCLGAVPVECYVSLAANYSSVYLYQPQSCGQCEIKNGLPMFEASVESAKQLLQLFDVHERLIIHSNEALSGFLPGRETARALDRRSFLSMIALNMRRAPAAIIEIATPVPGTVFSGNQLNRRKELISALKQLALRASGSPPVSLPIITPQIQQSCYFCGACAKLCPAGALRQSEVADVVLLEINPSLCRACNLCFNICPQGAIAFSPAVDTQDLLSEKFKILSAGEQKKCSNCESGYVANSLAEVCLRCRFVAMRGEIKNPEV